MAIINGTALIDNLIGTALADMLTGLAGNDTLDGGLGADVMDGGLGNDTYVVDNIGDVVTEALNAGTDTIRSSISYILGANVENLTLTGAAAISGIGNALNNVMLGNAAANVLVGDLGADTLDGGLGADTLIGGVGNDSYFIDNVGDVVVESMGGGVDTVQSGVSHSLSADVENLVLTGVLALNGTGNTLNNALTGNTAANILNGGTGADSMRGGLGNDTYVVDNLGDVVTEALNAGVDSVQSSISHVLGTNVENLTLTGAAVINGTGNALNNVLTGNAAANILNGGVGVDRMSGGLGNDTYVVDNIGDVVTEALSAGSDSVQSSISYVLSANVENLVLTGVVAVNGTGNALDNRITGNAANNTLDGGLGLDTMSGGLGNDTYIVDAFSWDVVIEGLNGGVDTVRSGSFTYYLDQNVENLVMTGSALFGASAFGNALNNSLTGTAGVDSLDGSLGADTMIGGAGDDTYMVDNIADVVTELLGGGVDTVNSNLNYVLSAQLENLTLSSGGAALTGTGNALNNSIVGNMLNNTLDGGAGNDTLNGDFGADTMLGGAGNDTYSVDNIGDVVTELLGAGVDVVVSTVSYTLGANVENLTLGMDMWMLGGGALAATGNALDNTIINNSFSSASIDGGVGNDTLTGDLMWADSFTFTTALNGATNLDTITNFVSTQDKIVLSLATFAAIQGTTPGVAGGALAVTEFVSGVGAVANAANAQILYDSTTGVLSYDVDGTGVGAAVAFVQLTGVPTILATDFSVG